MNFMCIRSLFFRLAGLVRLAVRSFCIGKEIGETEHRRFRRRVLFGVCGAAPILFPGMVQAHGAGMAAVLVGFWVILGLNVLILFYVFYRCAFRVMLLHFAIVAAIFCGYGFLLHLFRNTPIEGQFFLWTFLALVVLPAGVAYFLIRKKKKRDGWL